VSNDLAVAAVTATLRDLLQDALDDGLSAEVTISPLDKARGNLTGNQLNLFLYQTSIDAAWRNHDMPHVKPGESGHPPLPLVLNYLITAYGDEQDDANAAVHQVLGRAMRVLHDQPLLGPEDIRASLPGNDLHLQIERVRITPQPLSLDEVSKLWTAFQTQYRISAAYQACVVLIESQRPARTPLPVLTRGEEDAGVVAQASTVPPFPTLEAVVPPDGQPSAHLGDELRLIGHHLAGVTAVRLSHPMRSSPLTVPPPPLVLVGDTEVVAVLPNLPAEVPAGLYTVAGILGQPDRVTNEQPLAVAPKVTAGLPLQRPAGDFTLTLETSPTVRSGQQVQLLLGERPVTAAPPDPQAPSSVVFELRGIPAGEHLVRVRVDGVDSLLVNRSVSPPVFDTTQKVTLT
jgi:Pvc16 N-terminal domain